MYYFLGVLSAAVLIVIARGLFYRIGFWYMLASYKRAQAERWKPNLRIDH